jgi:hypothetical protein
MKIRSVLFVVLPAALVAVGLYRPLKKGDGPLGAGAGARAGFAVVELFTSEGCSSCPPADAVLAKIVAEHPDNVYVLGFHVDYWDRLGWKDAFSNAAYTRRQQEYGQALKLSSIYTPQVIVNGKKEMVGGEEKNLRAAIAEGLSGPAGKKIMLQTHREGNKIRVSFVAEGRGDDILYIALLQSHAETRVGAGENNGRRLQHVNIVRDLRTAPAGGSGSVDLEIPQGLQTKDCKVVAFLQSNKAGGLAVSGAAGAELP